MISFHPPIHLPSEKKQALLISSDYSKVINLLEEGIDGCPERIIDFDREYQYEGVEYGRAVYREIQYAIISELTDYSGDPVLEKIGTASIQLDYVREEIVDPTPTVTLQGNQDNQGPVNQIEPGMLIEQIEEGLDQQIVRSIEKVAGIIEAVNGEIDSQFMGKVSKDKADIFYAKFMEKFADITRNDFLAKIQSMLESPPGYQGIIVNGEHYGNKYIDYGWQEALRRVIAMIEGREEK